MTAAESHTQRPVVRDGFTWEPIPDGCLLFEESTGQLLTLNGAAEVVLTHCDGELTEAEICQVLERDFAIPAAETRSLLHRLREAGVILPLPAA